MISSLIRPISFLILFTFSPWLLANEVSHIPDFSASYSVSLSGIEAGELKRSLKTQADGKRIFQSETQAKGIFAVFKPEIITETSHWELNNHYIRPLKYSYVREGGKKNKYMFLDFDWQAKQLHIDDKKQPWSLSLVAKTLDKLVYQIALMRDLQEQQTTFSYQIADGGKIKTYDIVAYGTETINTAMGEIEAIKLKRERSEPKDRQTTLWCAPSLNFLPVKLEHIEKDGTVFTASIKQLDGIVADQAFAQQQAQLN